MRERRILAVVAAVLGLGAAAADLRPSADVRHLATEIEAEADHISALDLGTRIRSGEPDLRVLDLRSEAEFTAFHIPGARNVSLTKLAAERLPRQGTTVLYSEGGTHAAQAWVLLRVQGYGNVFVLRDGIYEWISRVFQPRLAVDASAAERVEFARAAELSRFFGGTPLSGVPRSEVPQGYWTGATPASAPLIEKIHRRGC